MCDVLFLTDSTSPKAKQCMGKMGLYTEDPETMVRLEYTYCVRLCLSFLSPSFIIKFELAFDCVHSFLLPERND